MQRIKVYRLNEEGLWDDRGTGHVSVEMMEVRRACRAAGARGPAAQDGLGDPPPCRRCLPPADAAARRSNAPPPCLSCPAAKPQRGAGGDGRE